MMGFLYSIRRINRLITVFIILLIILLTTIHTPLLAQSDLSIGGSVNYNISLTVYPEKRIPVINNWSAIYNLKVHNVNSPSSQLSATFNTNSLGSITPLSLNGSILNNSPSYDLYLTGHSHLTKKYSSVPFNLNTFTLDLRPQGDLIAGDTNYPKDNIINASDLAITSNALNTTTFNSDLNLDGFVNSLDLSIIIINFGLIGD